MSQDEDAKLLQSQINDYLRNLIAETVEIVAPIFPSLALDVMATLLLKQIQCDIEQKQNIIDIFAVVARPNPLAGKKTVKHLQKIHDQLSKMLREQLILLCEEYLKA